MARGSIGLCDFSGLLFEHSNMGASAAKWSGSLERRSPATSWCGPTADVINTA